MLSHDDLIRVQELKHLYVAVTRAKKNIIFFDRDPAKRAPFFQYVRARDLARIIRRCCSTLSLA